MDFDLKKGERADNTGFGGIKVIQEEGLGYGVDAVLLACFAAGETGAKGMRAGCRAIDLGTGSGIVSFIISHKVPDSLLRGIDVRENAVSRASRACMANGLEDRITFETADVSGYSSDEEYDAALSNPPYFRKGAAIPAAADGKYTARHETTADIGEFARTASRLLGDGGDFYLVHRPDRLADIFEALRAAGLEPKEMQLVVPKAGEPANIVLIHAVKGAGAELRMLPEIAVHRAGGGYTDVIESLYERSVKP